MAGSDGRLAWYVTGRRFIFCVGAALFFGGWASAVGAGSDDLSVPAGAFILAFFVLLRELRVVRDPSTTAERII
ncbi:MAG: hypothetical protein IPJ41_11695 [Phycisphaerales bacterium]|nr:hypothetical protein [Phycisphaerales bacterium]